MRSASRPRLHVFVCANRRDEASRLGPGCGARGEAVNDALEDAVSKAGASREIWITKSGCIGMCPERGAAVAVYPSADPIRTEVEPADAPRLLDEATRPTPDWAAIEREIVAAEELQSKKVLDLARRLKPGLTFEDIQNPHDFPDLDDPDWHYADGVLSGLQSVAVALRALRNRGEI